MSISVVLLSGCAALPVKSAVKDDQPHVDRWNDLPVPGSYDPDAFTIAEGSDILFLETGSNGQSVYAVVSGGQNHLYATDDNGASWEKLSSMAPGITSLIASPSCDQTLYYSTDTRVYRSTDGGQSFRALAVLRDVETGGGEITGIDVTRWQGAKVLAAGVKAPGRETRGGVYLLLPDEMLASWRDTGLSGLDVFAVSFLPEENGELSIAAVGNDGMHSWVTAMFGQSGWDSLWQKIELAHRSGEAVSSLESAVISLHPGYQSDTYHGFLVGLDTGMGRGDIYRVHLGQEPFSSQAYSVYHRIDSHLDNVDISVIYQNADGLIYTGLANSPGVLTSTDSASTWQQTESLFTGNRVSGLAVSGSGHFVATSGPESAVSFSDRGSGWQQTAFIDTRIDVVVDFALSCPEGSRKGIYLLTWGGEASLWYFKDSGTGWSRLFSSAVEGVSDIEKILLSPGHDENNPVVFLAGTGTGGPAIWRSENSSSFTRRPAPAYIDCWATGGDNCLVLGTFGAAGSQVHVSCDGGTTFDSAPAGTVPLKSISLHCEDEQNCYVLAGDISSRAYLSADGGESFSRAGEEIEPGFGIVAAFDASFAENGIIWAGSDSFSPGIYSLDTNAENTWRKHCSSMPSAPVVSIESVSPGAVYAASFAQADPGQQTGGVIRLLKPGTRQECYTSLLAGLKPGATLWKIATRGEYIWAMDTTHNQLLYFRDTLITAPEQIGPLHESGAVGVFDGDAIQGVSLDWAPVTGAAGYSYQVATTSAFYAASIVGEGVVTASQAGLPPLEVNTRYYWRVRTDRPLCSPWSPVFSFTSALGGEIQAPVLESPAPGARAVPVKPVFQWKAVSGAHEYELLISADPSFEETVIQRSEEAALPSNAWQCEEKLEHETSYFWKIRAVSPYSASAWSPVGSFNTAPQPGETEPTQPAATSAPPKTVFVTATTIITSPPRTVTLYPEEPVAQTIIITAPPVAVYPPQGMVTPDWLYLMLGVPGVIAAILAIMVAAMLTARQRGRG